MRKKIAEAIDVPSLVKEVYGAYGVVAQSMYPTGILSASLAPVSYPAKAITVSGVRSSTSPIPLTTPGCSSGWPS